MPDLHLTHSVPLFGSTCGVRLTERIEELEAENKTLKQSNAKLLDAQVSTEVTERSSATVTRAEIEDPTAPFVVPGDR